MGKTKITEVSITSLKMTADDRWLKNWLEKTGKSIYTHPNYLMLKGRRKEFDEWMISCHRDIEKRFKHTNKVLQSIKKHGQRKPIIIDKENNVLDGHKRTACMAFIGYDKIKFKRSNTIKTRRIS